MSITYLIRFKVRPGEVDRFLEHLNPVLDAMRHEASFHEAVLHRDPEDDHRFLLYETWADPQEVIDVQLTRSYREAWHAALPDLLAEPRDISMWRTLRTDRAGF